MRKVLVGSWGVALVVAVGLGVLLGYTSGFDHGQKSGRSGLEKEAYDAGAGEYYPADTGLKFKFKNKESK